MLLYEQARQIVIEQVKKNRGALGTEDISVWDALGFVLAQEVKSDREYPPFHRSLRDGYAVRSTDISFGITLPCVGEIKAGDTVRTVLVAGTCIQIMTGAAVPPGADAVVMVEHIRREKDRVTFDRPAKAGQHIVAQGSETAKDQIVLKAGAQLGFAELGVAAQVGAVKLKCAKKPRVAILSTGDEIVLVDDTPGPFQIRNSNSVSLAAQVRLAGGEPVILGNAPDNVENLSAKITDGLNADILVLSGGVSMGKYDLVEDVLKALGAEFYFDAVAIRPGKPAVFGICKDKPVFGLPGNPVSTMVTFGLFVTPAIDVLSGAEARPLPLLQATLAEELNEKPGMAHFLPARITWQGTEPQVSTLRWQSSGDVAAVAKSNCFLVVPPDRDKVSAGEKVSVWLRKDVA
jgi:molybdopterin molybdotransferase